MTAVFDIPPLYCPIPSAVHPEADLIERRAIEWIDHCVQADAEQRNRLVQTKSADFWARSAPSGITERVQTAAQWVYVAFALDDLFDTGSLRSRMDAFLALGPTAPRVLEIPEDGVSADARLTPLRDIGLSFRQYAGSIRMRRFVDAHRMWLLGVGQEIEGLRQHSPVSLADSVATRLHSDGGPVLTSMLELVTDLEIPEPEMSSPVARAMTEITWLLLGWDNDLHSHFKETHDAESAQNLVDVLAREHRLSTGEAVAEAVAMRDRCVTLFLRLKERAQHRASADLSSYLDSLADMIRANNDWGFRVPRYTSAVDDTERTRHPEYAEEPSDTSTDPIAVPAISWWWQLLD